MLTSDRSQIDDDDFVIKEFVFYFFHTTIKWQSDNGMYEIQEHLLDRSNWLIFNWIISCDKLVFFLNMLIMVVVLRLEIASLNSHCWQKIIIFFLNKLAVQLLWLKIAHQFL